MIDKANNLFQSLKSMFFEKNTLYSEIVSPNFPFLGHSALTITSSMQCMSEPNRSFGGTEPNLLDIFWLKWIFFPKFFLKQKKEMLIFLMWHKNVIKSGKLNIIGGRTFEYFYYVIRFSLFRIPKVRNSVYSEFTRIGCTLCLRVHLSISLNIQKLFLFERSQVT